MAEGEPVGGEVILDEIVGERSFPFHIRVEMGGKKPCGVGRVDQKLPIPPQEPGGVAVPGLGHPLGIRAIGERGGNAIAGDDDGPVLKIIGKAAGGERPRPITVIGQRIASALGPWAIRATRIWEQMLFAKVCNFCGICSGIVADSRSADA